MDRMALISLSQLGQTPEGARGFTAFVRERRRDDILLSTALSSTPLRVALLFCAAVAACSDEGATPATDSGPIDSGPFKPDVCKPSPSGPTVVTVGEGQNFYRDIPDNELLYWEKGPQGGHHVWLALKQRGLRMSGTIMTIDMEDVEDPAKPALVNHSKLVYDFDRDEGGWCTRPGLRMQLDNAGGVTLASLLGHKIKVVAVLKDPDGTEASGTKVIRVTGALD